MVVSAIAFIVLPTVMVRQGSSAGSAMPGSLVPTPPNSFGLGKAI